jgi:hypothetical protein
VAAEAGALYDPAKVLRDLAVTLAEGYGVYLVTHRRFSESFGAVGEGSTKIPSEVVTQPTRK